MPAPFDEASSSFGDSTKISSNEMMCEREVLLPIDEVLSAQTCQVTVEPFSTRK